ncbi:MAG TPA: hypothetical protein VF940_05685 [Streptosporangiaceae bacterium]
MPVHPVPRLLSRIGPLARAPMARSIARPTAGCSGASTTLPRSAGMATRAKSFGFADSSRGGYAAAGRTCASSSVSAGPPEPRGFEVGARGGRLVRGIS